ncbi:hypothetical protein TNCV_1204291 [Trichonephila clavipes]|nr:hypothetical protein TNCV_1204291 [Trichonephila clavipes]
MVWTRIYVGGKIDLHVLRPHSMTVVISRNVILVPYVRSFITVIDLDAMLMDDDTRIHGARVVSLEPNRRGPGHARGLSFCSVLSFPNP